jgi:2-methylisocitrate lyase-like PEP mutase family enzyme
MAAGLSVKIGCSRMKVIYKHFYLKENEMQKSNLDTAKIFRQLHTGETLVLANAWDAGSARLMEAAGSKAIATTSAGLAWANGYADGDKLPTDTLVIAVAAIARVIKVPLTVDIEGGYSKEPSHVADLIDRLIDAGAIGINIEDGEESVETLCAKIEAIRERVLKKGADLFINARTDVYLRGLASADKRVSETLRRAEIYKDAGTDGIFVPGVSHSADIRELCEKITLPVNVMALPSLPALAELNALGVKRLSAGAAISIAVLGEGQRLARAFLESGNSPDLFTPNTLNYQAMNAMF